DQDLVLVGGRVHREMHAEAGEAHPLDLTTVDLVLAVVEGVGIEPDVAHTMWGDLADRDRLLVEPAPMEEHDLERQLEVSPHRPLGPKTDVTELIVVERLDGPGEGPVRLLVGGRRQLRCLGGHIVEAEGLDHGGCYGCKRKQQWENNAKKCDTPCPDHGLTVRVAYDAIEESTRPPDVAG